MRRRIFLSTALLASIIVTTYAATELIRTRQGGRFEPAIETPQGRALSRLRVPPGFTISTFADGLDAPRMMAVSADGTVFVTRPSPGDVLALEDTDADGVADSQRPVIEKLEGVHGITIHQNVMYLATVSDVYAAPLRGREVGPPRKIVEKLPPGGRHPNRTLGVGPDGKLYISIGSTCNACVEEARESATIVRVGLDGRGREVFASGLRNTIGFGWHPATKQMWGMDHGSDWLGDEVPPEELNRLEAGKHYGWPFLSGRNSILRLEKYPPGIDPQALATKAAPSILEYTAHAAPIQMVFYTAQAFPEAYRGDAFVAMHGSWNRRPPSGFEVVRIHFQNGGPMKIEPFLSGFLAPDGLSTVARPAGLAVAGDGSLLVGDDANGVIYRVTPARTSTARR
jgi:glucose/arabinose dehydrogenase